MKKLLILLFLGVASILNAQTIYDYARDGDIESAQQLLEKDPSVLSSKNKAGYTPLILAAYYDHVDFAKWLFKEGVKIEEEQGDATALQAASYKGFTEMVKLLLRKGANPNIYDVNGTTPLIYAAQFGHSDIVALLIKNGADVNYKDPNGFNAVYYAQQLNNQEILDLLITE